MKFKCRLWPDPHAYKLYRLSLVAVLIKKTIKLEFLQKVLRNGEVISDYSINEIPVKHLKKSEVDFIFTYDDENTKTINQDMYEA